MVNRQFRTDMIARLHLDITWGTTGGTLRASVIKRFTPFAVATLLTLGLTLTAQTPVLDKAQAEPITDQIRDDPQVAAVLAPLAREMKAQYGQVLVEAPTAITRGRPGEENLLGYWVADLMRERAQQYLGVSIRFAITNKGGIRANLPQGSIKVSDIFQVMPFENELVVAEFTGAEIIQMVEDGIRRRNGEPCSGVQIKVTGTAKEPVIKVTWSDGTAIDPKETVRVALTDYLLSSGDSISALRKGRKPVLTGLRLRDLLLEACTHLGKSKTKLLPPAGGRYQFSPEIVQAMKDRTFK